MYQLEAKWPEFSRFSRRKRNLSFLVDALKAQWPHLDVAVNSRDDLVAQNGQFKVEIWRQYRVELDLLLVIKKYGVIRYLAHQPNSVAKRRTIIARCWWTQNWPL